MRVPTVGECIRYKKDPLELGEDMQVAFIVKVIDQDGGIVKLVTFDGVSCAYKNNVPYDEDEAPGNGTWNFG